MSTTPTTTEYLTASTNDAYTIAQTGGVVVPTGWTPLHKEGAGMMRERRG